MGMAAADNDVVIPTPGPTPTPAPSPTPAVAIDAATISQYIAIGLKILTVAATLSQNKTLLSVSAFVSQYANQPWVANLLVDLINLFQTKQSLTQQDFESLVIKHQATA